MLDESQTISRNSTPFREAGPIKRTPTIVEEEEKALDLGTVMNTWRYGVRRYGFSTSSAGKQGLPLLITYASLADQKIKTTGTKMGPQMAIAFKRIFD